jgi:hypothetical protein
MDLLLLAFHRLDLFLVGVILNVVKKLPCVQIEDGIPFENVTHSQRVHDYYPAVFLSEVNSLSIVLSTASE